MAPERAIFLLMFPPTTIKPDHTHVNVRKE